MTHAHKDTHKTTRACTRTRRVLPSSLHGFTCLVARIRTYFAGNESTQAALKCAKAEKKTTLLHIHIHLGSLGDTFSHHSGCKEPGGSSRFPNSLCGGESGCRDVHYMKAVTFLWSRQAVKPAAELTGWCRGEFIWSHCLVLKTIQTGLPVVKSTQLQSELKVSAHSHTFLSSKSLIFYKKSFRNGQTSTSASQSDRSKSSRRPALPSIELCR